MISILAYHQIAEVPPQHDPCKLAVTPDTFTAQMAWLHRKGYRCLGLGEAVHHLFEDGPEPDKCVVITFDDGYRDLHTTVWPILERFGFTATVFMVTGRAGCASDWEGQQGSRSARLLTWPEVQELDRAGFTFASHSVTHPRLTRLSDSQARSELERSRKTLEDQLGKPVDLFAYPYGKRDARIQRIAAECGYRAACGCDRGHWDRFNLWRSQCARNDGRVCFAFKASGWHQCFTWFREQSLVGPPLRWSWQMLKGSLGRTVNDAPKRYHEQPGRRRDYQKPGMEHRAAD